MGNRLCFTFVTLPLSGRGPRQTLGPRSWQKAQRSGCHRWKPWIPSSFVQCRPMPSCSTWVVPCGKVASDAWWELGVVIRSQAYPSMLGADVFVQSLCLGESAKKLRIRLKVKVCQYSCIWGCRADYMGSHMHPTKIPNHLIPIRVQMRRHPYISYISAVIKTLAGCYRILH